MKPVLVVTIGCVLLLTATAQAQVDPPRPSASPSPAVSSQGEDCGCEDKPLPELLAVVNGIKITKAELTEATQKRIKELQQQVIDARKREVGLQINSLLLEAEAKKRGITSAKLLEIEVVGKAVAPTEAEALAFYNQNNERIGSEFAAVKQDIISYLKEDRQRQAAQALADRLRSAAALKLSSDPVTPALSPAARARVFATVNGRNITSGDVEDNLKPLVFAAQESMYKLRKQDVEIKINDILLEQESKKRGLTMNALFDQEVKNKLPAVTEAEALKFYNENKERLNGEFPTLKDQIVKYLGETAERNAEGAFATRLRNSAQVQMFLTAPVPPTYQIAVDDQPTRGNPSAAVTLVEFTDFECLSCAKQQPVIERLIAEYGSRIRFVVRDFPLAQHEYAEKAAEAAEAAREQGKYWEYAALLYRNPSALTIDSLKQYASTLGLDRARFDAGLDSGKFFDKIMRDRLDGEKIGVSSAPVFFVNGRRVADSSYEGLKSAIEQSSKP
jgi:protein-disulfide isomerase